MASESPRTLTLAEYIETSEHMDSLCQALATQFDCHDLVTQSRQVFLYFMPETIQVNYFVLKTILQYIALKEYALVHSESSTFTILDLGCGAYGHTFIAWYYYLGKYHPQVTTVVYFGVSLFEDVYSQELINKHSSYGQFFKYVKTACKTFIPNNIKEKKCCFLTQDINDVDGVIQNSQKVLAKYPGSKGYDLICCAYLLPHTEGCDDILLYDVVSQLYASVKGIYKRVKATAGILFMYGGQSGVQQCLKEQFSTESGYISSGFLNELWQQETIPKYAESPFFKQELWGFMYHNPFACPAFMISHWD